jgi:hypothetical protein
MAPAADAEDHFAFIALDGLIEALAVLVTHLSANVCCVDRWLLTGCELMPHHPIIHVHALIPGTLCMMPSDSQE